MLVFLLSLLTQVSAQSYCLSTGPTAPADTTNGVTYMEGEEGTFLSAPIYCAIGLRDLTDQIVKVHQGKSYNITWGGDTCGISFVMSGKIWVDWYHQGWSAGPERESDQIVQGQTGLTPWSVTQTFVVPVDAPEGQLRRMRVMGVETQNLALLTPCGSFFYGGTTDFSVQVVAAPVPTPARCPNITCQTSAGASCGADTECMQPDLFCNGQSCLRVAYLGDSCAFGADCEHGSVCTDDICQRANKPGDACGTCNGPNLVCGENGVCASTLPNCATQADCHPGHDCVYTGESSACQPFVQSGAACTASVSCAPGLSCNMRLPAPVCQELFSLPDGSLGYDELCQSAFTDPATERCRSPPDSLREGLSCEESSDCPTSDSTIFADCECTNFGTGNEAICAPLVGSEKKYFKAMATYDSCASAASCWVGFQSGLEPSVCGETACRTELSDAWCLYQDTLEESVLDGRIGCFDSERMSQIGRTYCHRAPNSPGGMSDAVRITLIVLGSLFGVCCLLVCCFFVFRSRSTEKATLLPAGQ